MKKEYIVCLMFFCLLFACTQGRGNYLVFEEIVDSECHPIPYSELLAVTMQIQKYDSLLLINDFHGDSLIHVVDLQNHHLLRKLIRQGNGPDEMISPLEFHIIKNKLYIYSRQQFFLNSISLENINKEKISMNKLFQVPSKVSRILPLNDSVFIASGFFEKKYALIDALGEVVSEFGEYPGFWNEEINIPTAAKGMFHQSQFSKSPINDNFISFSSHVLDIFTFSDRVPVLVKRIPLGEYRYSYTTGEVLSARRSSDTEEGVVDASCSSNYIYLVYNSNKREEMPISQIMVLDWEGRPVKLININKDVTCLYIDEDEKNGYIIVRDPEDSLMFFKL